jgi:hypothetical protein
MSLDRKDLRVYFDPAVHAALVVVAEVDGLEPARLIEREIERYVLDRVHSATVIAARADVAGLSRIRPVSSGNDRPVPVAHRKAR